MATPVKLNHMTFTIPVRYLDNLLCTDWNFAIPSYAKIRVKHIRTHEIQVARVNITLTAITGANQGQICRKGRATHDRDFSRLHGIPHKINSEADPCYACQGLGRNRCNRCFKDFGDRGPTKEDKQKYHEQKDGHDCFIQALRELAQQDSPQGRAAALQLAKYVPLHSSPPQNLMGSKPTEKQIKLAAEALLDPMYLQTLALEKAAIEAQRTHNLNRNKERAEKTKTHDEHFHPAHKQKAQSRNPAFKKLKSSHSVSQIIHSMVVEDESQL